MTCMGFFGRHYYPQNFFDRDYVLERTEYRDLGNDKDWHLGHRYLNGVIPTCNGQPAFVTVEQRNASVLYQLEDCRAQAQRADRELNEQVGRERDERTEQLGNPGGAHGPPEGFSHP